MTDKAAGFMCYMWGRCEVPGVRMFGKDLCSCHLHFIVTCCLGIKMLRTFSDEKQSKALSTLGEGKPWFPEKGDISEAPMCKDMSPEQIQWNQ